MEASTVNNARVRASTQPPILKQPTLTQHLRQFIKIFFPLFLILRISLIAIS